MLILKYSKNELIGLRCLRLLTALPLYVKTSSIPSYPVYFEYDGFCYHIDSDEYEVLIK